MKQKRGKEVVSGLSWYQWRMKYNRNNFDKGRSKLLEPTTTDTTEHYKGRKQKNKGGLQGISEQNELGVVQKLRKEKTGH